MASDTDRDPIEDGPSERESEFLLTEFAAGDDTAFGKLFEREAPFLRRRLEQKLPEQFLRRVGVSDIIQQTSIELLGLRERFENRGYGAFRRLLETIADRLLAKCIERERAAKRDVFRQAKTTPGSTDASGAARSLDRIAGPDETPSRVAAKKEEIEAMKSFLARLGDADREIIQLVDYEDLGYEGAAKLLGISTHAAMKRRSRAMARLREMVERREDR